MPELTESEYRALSDLYNNYNAAFQTLPTAIQGQFWDRIYKKDKLVFATLHHSKDYSVVAMKV